MIDDVILNKMATIEVCLKRVQDNYQGHESFSKDINSQDVVVLNLLRACEACIDIGQRIIRQERFGIPQSSRDVFTLLEKQEWISNQLSKNLQNMVSFRNIAVHEYEVIQLTILESIIQNHLQDFMQFAKQIQKKLSKKLDLTKTEGSERIQQEIKKRRKDFRNETE